MREWRTVSAGRVAVAPFLALALAVVACASRPQPARAGVDAALLDGSRLPRIWVAGFIVNQDPEFDVSDETVRLLRFRLRQIQAPVVDSPPLRIDAERQFSDVAYWRQLAEERGDPLIVTGAVTLLLAPPAVVQRGSRLRYYPKAGRVLRATVVTIDGRTGEQLASEVLPQRMRYEPDLISSSLGLYFQMMDDTMPSWMASIARAGRKVGGAGSAAGAGFSRP